jgi:hypothetical protein
MKRATLAAEWFDYRAYLPWPEGDLDALTLANGLSIRTEKPLERWTCAFADPSRDTELRLHSSALMPPAAPARGGHLVQAVRTSGELRLRGERIAIDGFFTRDRSWGAPREEAPFAIPPLGWMAGVFGPDLAFHVAGFDPSAVRFGYVFRDGATHAIAHMERRTERAPDGLTPRAIALELDDAGGAHHSIRGEITSCLPWHVWPNVHVHFCQTRWTCGARVGHGDVQDMCFGDVVRNAYAK